jgi:hypothetical protein
MAKKKKPSNPRTRKESIREIYARYRREFSAGDLQKYTELDLDKGVPLAQIIAELESLPQKEARRRKKA